MKVEIVSALALGLAGSLHCVGMCGPIAIALPRSPAGSRTAFLQGRLLYNLGRTITYTALGVVFGLLGKSLNLAGWQQVVSIACGSFMLLYVVGRYLPRGRWGLSGWTARILAPIQQALASRLGGDSRANLLVIGLLNGLLPCGLVYVALVGAVATGTVWGGALFMLVFGMGTAPLLLALSLAGPSLYGRLRGRFQVIVPVGLAILGILFILRGSNLGIPYVSPKLTNEPGSPAAKCCSR